MKSKESASRKNPALKAYWAAIDALDAAIAECKQKGQK